MTQQHQEDGNKGNLKNVYERVTQRIVEQLEAGVVPWRSPHFAKVGFPVNFQSGNPYRGINVILLGMAGYVSPYFLTYQQAAAKGGQVRRGEKGYSVIKFGTIDTEQEEGAETRRFFLRHYTVFNACQIDGIDFPEPPARSLTEESAQCDRAREIVAGMPHPPAIHEGRFSQAFYRPGTDEVEMPARTFFETELTFYSTLFHELTHATGHLSRLARKSLLENKGINTTGECLKIYSQEELVAEIGAAFLSAHAGIVIDDHQNSAAYIASWLKTFRDSKHQRWIVEAAAQAQKASDYVLNGGPS